MSKKSLKNGLESIFGVPTTPIAEVLAAEEETVSFFVGKDEPPKQKILTRRPVLAGKSLSSKDFTSNLESLLQNALDDSMREQGTDPTAATAANMGKVAKTRPMTTSPLSGLDALIRQTITATTTDVEEDNPNAPLRQRITLVFDKQKLDKLKHIARIEQAYLKDVVNQIIADYLEQYEKNKGNLQPS